MMYFWCQNSWQLLNSGGKSKMVLVFEHDMPWQSHLSSATSDWLPYLVVMYFSVLSDYCCVLYAKWWGVTDNRAITPWLLSKHGVPCLATLRECRMKQMPRRSYQLPPRRIGGDHQDTLIQCGLARSEIQWPLPEWSSWHGWESSTLRLDWCLRLAQHTPGGACQIRRSFVL